MDEEQPKCLPVHDGHICVPVVDTILLLPAMHIQPSFPFVYLSGVYLSLSFINHTMSNIFMPSGHGDWTCGHWFPLELILGNVSCQAQSSLGDNTLYPGQCWLQKQSDCPIFFWFVLFIALFKWYFPCHQSLIPLRSVFSHPGH